MKKNPKSFENLNAGHISGDSNNNVKQNQDNNFVGNKRKIENTNDSSDENNDNVINKFSKLEINKENINNNISEDYATKIVKDLKKKLNPMNFSRVKSTNNPEVDYIPEKQYSIEDLARFLRDSHHKSPPEVYSVINLENIQRVMQNREDMENFLKDNLEKYKKVVISGPDETPKVVEGLGNGRFKYNNK